MLLGILGGIAFWQYQQYPQRSQQIVCTFDVKAGLNLTLRDEKGDLISGALIKIKQDQNPLEEFPSGSGTYSGLREKNGRFDFTITKEGYEPLQDSVYLEKDVCHVIPLHRDITLTTKT